MRIILMLVLLLPALNLIAQEFQEISVGAGYLNQSYIRLADGSQHHTSNTAWDIAFSVAGQDAGIFINESSGVQMGVSIPHIALYDAQTNDFSEVPDSSVFLDFPLFNDERSWSEGAFNEVADSTDPFDFGWGSYDPTTHQISGGPVYVILLRDSIYRKIQIQLLSSGTYSFRTANLDGSDEKSKSVSKGDAEGNTLAYYSFATDTLVDVEPYGGFDLLYCRYITPLDAGDGSFLDYAVTGILSGPGVSAAKAQFVDPVTVDPTVYLDSFQTNLDVIGHDWKAFILSTFTYEIPDSVVYFVKVANDDIWKLTFLDFEGSSTGTAVFEKEKLGVLTPVLERRAPLSHFGIYPNPTISTINVICESDRLQAMRSKIAVSDLSGKILVVQPIQIVPGLNAFELNIDLASGVYQVSIRTGRSIVSRQLVISQTIHH